MVSSSTEGELNRVTGLLLVKLEVKDWELEACGHPSLFSETHKDSISMAHRPIEKKVLTLDSREYSWPSHLDIMYLSGDTGVSELLVYM